MTQHGSLRNKELYTKFCKQQEKFMFKYGMNAWLEDTGGQGESGIQSNVVQDFELIKIFIYEEPPSKIKIK